MVNTRNTEYDMGDQLDSRTLSDIQSTSQGMQSAIPNDPLGSENAVNGLLKLIEQSCGMPRWEIPKFSGNLFEWPAWWASFKERVWLKSTFSDTSKVCRLRQLLPEEDACLLPVADFEKPDLKQVEKFLSSRYEASFVVQHAVSEEIRKLGQLSSHPTCEEWRRAYNLALRLESATMDPLTLDQLRDKLAFKLPQTDRRELMKQEYKSIPNFRKYLEDSYCLALEEERRGDMVAERPSEPQPVDRNPRQVPRFPHHPNPPTYQQRSAYRPNQSNYQQRPVYRPNQPSYQQRPAYYPGPQMYQNYRPRYHWNSNSHPLHQTNAAIIEACPMCQGSHVVPDCPIFQQIPVQQRGQFFRIFGLCFRCGKHRYQREFECTQTCGKCGQLHATILCTNPNVRMADSEPIQETGDLNE